MFFVDIEPVDDVEIFPRLGSLPVGAAFHLSSRDLDLSLRLRLSDSPLDVGFIDHVDGLELFGFRKGFRGLNRCGKLVKLHLVPLAIPHHESSAPRMFPVHRGRSVQHQDIASLGGNVTRRLDAFDLDHMLPCLRRSIFPETTYR